MDNNLPEGSSFRRVDSPARTIGQAVSSVDRQGTALLSQMQKHLENKEKQIELLSGDKLRLNRQVETLKVELHAESLKRVAAEGKVFQLENHMLQCMKIIFGHQDFLTAGATSALPGSSASSGSHRESLSLQNYNLLQEVAMKMEMQNPIDRFLVKTEVSDSAEGNCTTTSSPIITSVATATVKIEKDDKNDSSSLLGGPGPSPAPAPQAAVQQARENLSSPRSEAEPTSTSIEPNTSAKAPQKNEKASSDVVYIESDSDTADDYMIPVKVKCYRCDLCDKVFTSEDDVRRHKITFHFQCPECNKKQRPCMMTLAELSKHVQLVHNKTLHVPKDSITTTKAPHSKASEKGRKSGNKAPTQK